jgi:hypothetical protein
MHKAPLVDDVLELDLVVLLIQVLLHSLLVYVV